MITDIRDAIAAVEKELQMLAIRAIMPPDISLYAQALADDMAPKMRARYIRLLCAGLDCNSAAAQVKLAVRLAVTTVFSFDEIEPVLDMFPQEDKASEILRIAAFSGISPGTVLSAIRSVASRSQL